MPDDLSRFDAMLRRAEPVAAPRSWGSDRGSRDGRGRLVGRIVAASVALLVIGLATAYVVATLTAPVGAAVASSRVPDVTAPAATTIAMSPAGESAISVTGADAYLGAGASGILAASGGDAAVPIASISKLITAMVVLEHRPLGASGTGPTLTFSKADHDLYDAYYVRGATIAAMPTNSTMTEHDAIETMLVVSASNYAEAVSTWAFGSQPAFVSAARSWLKRHGLTGTRIYEPTGLDTRNVGTPSDMIALGRLAKADPVISTMAAMTALDVPALKGMPNTNSLLGVDGIDGLKTGTLEDTGANLLFSAKVDVGLPEPLGVIGVVLSGGSHDTLRQSVSAMLASLHVGFHPVVVAKRGQEIGRYRTAWGSTATMVLAEDASVMTWSDTPITAKLDLTPLGSGRDGERVGTARWAAGPNTASVPVELKGSIRPPGVEWRLTHPRELLWGGTD